MQKGAKRQNLTVIQALRGIAAIWVVLFHANEGGHIPFLKKSLPELLGYLVFDAGHFGVAIFFALSGFVISYGLDRSKTTIKFFLNFIIRRSIRLDPPYWASILVSLSLIILSSIIKQEYLVLPTFSSILSHILYLQLLLGEPEINAAYWTLTYEVQFYAFFVGALTISYYFRKRFDNKYCMVIDLALLSIAVSSCFGKFDQYPAGIFLPLWPSFYVGVLAHSSISSNQARISFALVLISMMFNGMFSIVSAATAIFLFISLVSGWAISGMNWRWLQFLGAISYSLYLIHNPVTGAIGFLFNKIPMQGALPDILKLIAILSFSILAAYILWVTVEKKTHEIARSFFMKNAS